MATVEMTDAEKERFDRMQRIEMLREREELERLENAEFLRERGWRDNYDNATWSDMNPPGDELVEAARITQRDKQIKVVQQTKVGPAPGLAYPFAVALQIEKSRRRDPLPPFEAFKTKVEGGAERHMVRDRQKQIGAGPFEEQIGAEAWIAEQKPK